MKKKYLLIFIIPFLFSSCTRHIKYIQIDGEKKGEAQTEFSNQPPDYKIQPYDYLYVTIRTTNKDVNELFNTISTSYNSNQGGGNAQNFYFTGYMINDSGYVHIPLLGVFFVKDKTISDIREILTARTAEILKDAVVNVRLTSFRVTFLGEIGNGTTTFYQEKLNILEAVAAMGGINDYGDKTNILVVRKQDTTYHTYRVDLTDRYLLEKEEFYLQPNDIVYVEPIKSKIFRQALADYSMFIGLFTSTASIVSTILILLTLN